MKVEVMIFGQLREITGTAVCSMEDVEDTDEVVKKMNSMFPALEKMQYVIAVEKDIVHRNTKLFNNFTVAMLPPYSGG